MSRPDSDVELVRVFSSADPAVIAVAKSLLDAEQIDYSLRNQDLQSVFGPNFVVNPPEFWVRQEDADRARELLKDLTAP